MERYIHNKIEEYIAEGFSPWHMPGHKRREELNPAFRRDFTEVKGLDDYHHPEEMIKASMEAAARVYDTYKSYYLINGSTSGILAAMHAAVSERRNNPVYKERDKEKAIIIARNCHKSVFNAMLLLGIKPIYIYPDYLFDGRIYGGVRAYSIEEAIAKNPMYEIVAAVVTSPTYEGIISDIEGVSRVCHDNNIRLIVDEAHGAHLPFCDKLGKSALYLGADIVIQSLHKTLKALTQTAIVHVADKRFTGRDNEKLDIELRKYLSVFQSSSPSYVLMEGIEECIAYTDENRRMYDSYLERLDDFIRRVEGLKNIHLLKTCDDEVLIKDKSRLVFFLDKITGEKALESLYEKKLAIEMAGPDYIVLISTPMDEERDFDLLHEKLKELDYEISGTSVIDNKRNEVDITVETEKGSVNILAAEGLRIKNYIYVYPPGIPIVAPYEVITKEMINEIRINYLAGKSIHS